MWSTCARLTIVKFTWVADQPNSPPHCLLSAINNPGRHFSNDCVCGGIALFKAIELVPVSIAVLTYFIYPLITAFLRAMTSTA
jgi:hypothetical protein